MQFFSGDDADFVTEGSEERERKDERKEAKRMRAIGSSRRKENSRLKFLLRPRAPFPVVAQRDSPRGTIKRLASIASGIGEWERNVRKSRSGARSNEGRTRGDDDDDVDVPT